MEASHEAREQITVRPASPADGDFVLATWLKGHRHGSAFAARLTNDVYFRNHHDVVTAILAQPTTHVWVACLEDAPEVILGYLVHEDQTIHWAYTKRELRRFGIFSRLIEAAGLPSDLSGVTASHDSYQFRRELEARYPAVRFNPYLAFRPRPNPR